MIRYSIDLSDEEKRRLDRLPWGWKKLLFQKLISEINLIIDRYGMFGIALILEDQTTLLKYIEQKEGVKHGDFTEPKAFHKRDE